MITFNTDLGKVHIVETPAELPEVPLDCDLIVDIETTYAKPFEQVPKWQRDGAFYPFNGNKVAGIGISVGRSCEAFYVPIRHRVYGGHNKNLPLEVVREWCSNQINRARRVVGHNAKFDLRFLYFDGVRISSQEVVCTEALAKLFDTELPSHGLKPCAKRYLQATALEEVKIQIWLREAKSKDYGDLPVDIAGEYCGQDCLMTDGLYQYYRKYMPASMIPTVQLEIKLTPVLLDMEIRGVKVDVPAVKKRHLLTEFRLLELETDLKLALGREYTNSNKCLQDVILNQLGLPVLVWGKPTQTGKRNPSFNKEAMAKYFSHPDVLREPKTLEVIKWIHEHRTLSHFNGLYYKPWLDFADENGRIHPTYNQVVRTGRMSNRQPCLHQADGDTKQYVIPDEYFHRRDASQIELRLIVDRIQDLPTIEQYQKDPKTDMHAWAAEGICERPTGKTMNFAMGYGARERRIVSTVSVAKEIMQKILREMEESSDNTADYTARCEALAKQIYERYHAKFPNLQPESDRTTEQCKRDGYIENRFGRRRHLSYGNAYKAFNTYAQSTANDIVKYNLVDGSPRYNEVMRRFATSTASTTHDDVVWDGPNEPAVVEEIDRVLAIDRIPDLSVPILWDGASSNKSLQEVK